MQLEKNEQQYQAKLNYLYEINFKDCENIYDSFMEDNDIIHDSFIQNDSSDKKHMPP